MPSQSAPPRHRAKPWVRRRRMLLLFVALFLLLPMAFLLATSHFSDTHYEARLNVIRDSGFPVTAGELQDWKVPESTRPDAETLKPPIQDADTPKDTAELDAATVYGDALESIMSKTGERGLPEISALLEILDKHGDLSEAELADLRRLLQEHENEIRLLMAAAEKLISRFPLDYSKGYAMELSHLAKLRQAARLLLGAAHVAALDNDPELACRAVMAGLAFNRPLEQEPLLISQLVRWAVNSIMVNALGDTLGRAEYTDAQLAQLQRVLAAGHDPMALRNALVSERVFGIWAYDNVSQAFVGDLMENRLPGAVSVLVQTASAMGWYNTDRNTFLGIMDQMIQVSTLPYTESSAIMQNLSENTAPRFILPSLNDLLLPSLGRVPEAMARNDARITQASTACAIERYRLANGTPPETLTALVPAYLPAVPLDPFDSQPMRYRREGSAYTLYSVNMDGVDGGGVAGENAREGDLVFRRRP